MQPENFPCLPLLLLIMLVLSVGCSGNNQRPPATATDIGESETPTPAELHLLSRTSRREAAVKAGNFLVRITSESGLFTYLIDPQRQTGPKYNWLRHAGTIYALCQLYEVTGAEPYLSSAKLAATRLRLQIRPAQFGDRTMTALISDPAFTNSNPGLGPVVKTGGCALSMLSLSYLDELTKSEANRETLLALGEYICFTQLPSGSLNSKYLLNAQRFDDWQSEYYQGEALVGLARVERKYPRQENRATMIRLLAYLAGRWRQANEADANGTSAANRGFDHWSQLGLHACFTMLQDAELTQVGWSRKDLLQTAVTYCEGELDRIHLAAGPAQPAGSFFGREGDITPAAIRLEGIQAVQSLYLRFGRDLGVSSGQPMGWWDERINLTLRYLRSAQFTEAQAAQWPHVPNLTGAVRKEYEMMPGTRSCEVRIDYCQHAISAWLAPY